MPLCVPRSCACTFESATLTIEQAGGVVSIELAGESPVTELLDRMDDVETAIAALEASFPVVSSTWTPTVGGITKGSGTETARYIRLGPLVCCYYRFVFGAGSSQSGDISITHPVAAIEPRTVGAGYAVDASAPNRFDVPTYAIGTGSVLFRPNKVDSTYATINTAASSTVPFGAAWTTSDEIVATWNYLAA